MVVVDVDDTDEASPTGRGKVGGAAPFVVVVVRFRREEEAETRLSRLATELLRLSLVVTRLAAFDVDDDDGRTDVVVVVVVLGELVGVKFVCDADARGVGLVVV